MTANFYAAISASLGSDGNRVCLETDDGLSYTRADLARESARYAGLLVDTGAVRGERIAVQVDKSPACLFLYLACLRAGLVYLPLNTAYQRGELRHFLEDAEPRIVICAPKSFEMMRELCPSHTKIFTLDEAGRGSLADAAAGFSGEFETTACEPDSLAAILYTSGTTGRSKGAMVTHRNLLSNARVLVDYWGFSDRDVLLHALPIFHIHGLFVANHCALLSGATMVWHRKFDAALIVRDLARATVMMGVPTFYTRLLAQPGFDRSACRTMRLFISGSAPLQLDTFSEFQARSGHAILERYGMSEAGMITSNPYDGERRGGTVGMPLPGVELRVVGPNLMPMPFDMPGDIQIRGPNVFKGYWRMPKKTKEEFTEDGWFKTGDVGTWTWGGWIAISGRAKDLIISGGYNVYPKEIELALDELPGVEESAVIGVPDVDFGEAVVAVIVPKKGSVIDPAGVIATMKEQLANYKAPKRVHIVEELPRNTMGKVQKNKLREMFG